MAYRSRYLGGFAKERSRSFCGLLAASTVILILCASCTIGWELKAWKFEPLSDTLRGDNTGVKWARPGWKSGDLSRRLEVRREGLVVSISGDSGSMPWSSFTVYIINGTDSALTMPLDKIRVVPLKFKGNSRTGEGVPALVRLDPSKPSEGEASSIEPQSEVRIHFYVDVSYIRKVHVDFVLQDVVQKIDHGFRFYLKKD